MSSSARVGAVDAARGIALVGMMLTHLGPRWEGENPPIGDLLFDGRAAPLFALLAGVSLTLVRRYDPTGAGGVVATVIRAALLLVVGLWLGSLEDQPVLVILGYYAVLVLLGVVLRPLPTRVLLPATLVWVVVGPVLLIAWRTSVVPPDGEQPGWSALGDPLDLLATFLALGDYPVLVWVAYLMAGLLVGRLDLTGRRVGAWLVGGGAVLAAAAFAIGLAVQRRAPESGRDGWRALLESDGWPYEPASWSHLWLAGPHTSMPLNVAGAIGSALLVLGLCVLVPCVLRRARIPLVAAAGSMTLTLYTAHLLWTWRAWVTSDEMAAFEPREVGYDVWLTQVVVLLVAAAVWRHWFRRGPLEQVVRTVSVTLPQRARALVSRA